MKYLLTAGTHTALLGNSSFSFPNLTLDNEGVTISSLKIYKKKLVLKGDNSVHFILSACLLHINVKTFYFRDKCLTD